MAFLTDLKYFRNILHQIDKYPVVDVVCVKFVNETLYTDTEFQLRLHLLYEEANKRLTQRRRHYSTQLFCEQQQRSLFPLLLVSGFIVFRSMVRDN